MKKLFYKKSVLKLSLKTKVNANANENTYTNKHTLTMIIQTSNQIRGIDWLRKAHFECICQHNNLICGYLHWNTVWLLLTFDINAEI